MSISFKCKMKAVSVVTMRMVLTLSSFELEVGNLGVPAQVISGVSAHAYSAKLTEGVPLDVTVPTCE